jgi:hypothetical protein
MRPAHHLNGYLYRVDPLAREIQVVVDGKIIAVDVPPDCEVHLNRERVKLRMLQPWDAVAIDGQPGPTGWVARFIRVGWEATAAAIGRENEAPAENV